jgi:small GTP-binding protein
LLDTAGQERFNGLGVGYFRWVDCCLLVYDVTKEISFDHLENWKDLCQQQEARFPLVVVGNKIDLQKECKFQEKVEKWCISNGFSHFETSAKSKIGVDEMFFKALQEVQISLDYQSGPIPLNQNTNSYFSYCC